MKQSETTNKLFSALIKAQSEFKPILTDGSNPVYKSKYATLHNIVEAVRPILRANGLGFTQTNTETDGTYVNVVTTVFHESGEWIQSVITLRPNKQDPQGIGSAQTYGRRYGLSSILGIVSDDDDDGNTASAPTADRTSQPKSEANTDDKPWLNATDKDGNLTKKGEEVVRLMIEDDTMTMDRIRRKYKVSKKDAETIELAVMNEKNPPAYTYNEDGLPF